MEDLKQTEAEWRAEQRRAAERAAQDESLNLSFNGLGVQFRAMFRDGKQEQMANGVTLSAEAWLGQENGLASLVGTESMVVKAGKHFAVVNLRKKSYALWKRPTSGSNVQALTHSLGKQLVLAYAEMRDKRAVLCVLKQGKERALEMPHEEPVIAQIQLTGKHAVSLSTAPIGADGQSGGSVLSYWNYEKERLTQRGEFKYELRKIAVSGIKGNQLAGAGKGLLRLFEATEKKVLEATTRLLSTKVERENDFVDVKFAGQAVVAVSMQNNLVVVQNNALRFYGRVEHTLRDELSRYSCDDDAPLESGVVPIQNWTGQGTTSNVLAVWGGKNILVGTKEGGLLTYLQMEKEAVRVGTFPCPDAANIRIAQFSLSSDEKHLLIVGEMDIRQQLGAEQAASVNARQWASVSHIEWSGGPCKTRTELYLLEVKQLKTFANSFTTPVVRVGGWRNPVGKVTGVAAPAIRGMVLTGHEDATLRLWTHEGSLARQVQALACHDVPLDVAMQPMGLVGAAGFRDGLRAYYVLEQGIRLAACWEGKPCQAVAFAHHGSLLAGGNGSAITVVDTVALKVVYVLREHPGLVEGLHFSENDFNLVSHCGAGLCYVWSSDFDQYDCHVGGVTLPKGGWHHQTKRQGVAGYGRQLELIVKPQRVLDFDYDDQYDLMVAATSDGRLRVVEKGGGASYMEVNFDQGQFPTTVRIVKQQEMLAIGQSDGSVRVLLWPILNVTQVRGVRVGVNLLESLVFKIHEAAVRKMEVTADCGAILTGAEDGSVYIHALKEAGALDSSLGSAFLEGGKQRGGGGTYGGTEHVRLEEVAYVMKTEVLERREQLRLLEKRLATERAELTKRLEQSEQSWSTKLQLREREMSVALGAEKEAADRAAADHEAEKALLLEKMEENAVRARREKEEREIEMQTRLGKATDEVGLLQEQLEEESAGQKKILLDVLEEQKEAFDLLEREFSQQVATLSAAHSRLLEQLQRSDQKYELALEQCEREYEKEVAKARAAFLGKQKALAGRYQQLKQEQELENRKVKKLAGRLEALEERYNATTQAQVAMAVQCEGRDRKLIEMQEQLEEREDVIRAKEATIRELRELNTQLENFRFVLDQKLLAMQSEQEPMQAQLRHLEAHVQRMFQEMVKATEERQRLEKDNAQKERIAKALQTQLDAKTASARGLVYQREQLLGEIQFLLSHPTGDILQQLAAIFRKYAANANIPPVEAKKKEEARKEKSEGKGGAGAEAPVQEELKRQRDWLDKKLQTVVERHRKLEQQKNHHIQRIQRENCSLIHECNILRGDNQTISKKVHELEKRLKTIVGSSETQPSPKSQQQQTFLQRVESHELKQMLSNMQKNKEAIEGQGKDMIDLQHKMTSFLARHQSPRPAHPILQPQFPPPPLHQASAPQLVSQQPVEREVSVIHSEYGAPPQTQPLPLSPPRGNASAGSDPSVSNVLQHKYSIAKASGEAKKFFREPGVAATQKFSADMRSTSRASPPRSPRLLTSAEHIAPALLSPQGKLISNLALRDSQRPPSLQLPSLKGGKVQKPRRNSITPHVGGFGTRQTKSVKSLRRGTSPGGGGA